MFKNNKGLFIVAIVALVAIVSLFLIGSNSQQGSYSDEILIDNEENIVGMAKSSGRYTSEVPILRDSKTTNSEIKTTYQSELNVEVVEDSSTKRSENVLDSVDVTAKESSSSPTLLSSYEENKYGVNIYWHNNNFEIEESKNDYSINLHKIIKKDLNLDNIVMSLELDNPVTTNKIITITDQKLDNDKIILTNEFQIKEIGEIIPRISFIEGQESLLIRNPEVDSKSEISFSLNNVEGIVQESLSNMGLGSIDSKDDLIIIEKFVTLNSDEGIKDLPTHAIKLVSEQRINNIKVYGRGIGRLSAKVVGEGEISWIRDGRVKSEYYSTINNQDGFRTHADALNAFLNGGVTTESQYNMDLSLSYLDENTNDIFVQNIEIVYVPDWSSGYLIPEYLIYFSYSQDRNDYSDFIIVSVPAFDPNTLMFTERADLFPLVVEEVEEEIFYDLSWGEIQDWAENNCEEGGSGDRSFTGNVITGSGSKEPKIMWGAMATVANRLLNMGYRCSWIKDKYSTTKEVMKYDLPRDSDFAYYHGHASFVPQPIWYPGWPRIAAIDISATENVAASELNNLLSSDNEILWIDSCMQMLVGYEEWKKTLGTGTHLIIAHIDTVGNAQPSNQLLELFFKHAIDNGETVKYALELAVEEFGKSGWLGMGLIADTENQLDNDHFNNDIGYVAPDEEIDDNNFYSELFY